MTHPRKPKPCVQVCQHRSCVRAGAEAVFAAFEAQAQATGDFMLIASDCMGQCSASPNVQVIQNDRAWYCRVTPEDVPEIVARHIQGGERVKRLLHPRIHQHDRG
jgi:(2Fe-2S) ferredoxin